MMAVLPSSKPMKVSFGESELIEFHDAVVEHDLALQVFARRYAHAQRSAAWGQHPDLADQRFAGEYRVGEAEVQPLQPCDLVAAQGLQHAEASNAVAAQAMQNRLRKTGDLRRRGVHVQRVQV